MKLEPRTLALRCEQYLEGKVPEHIVKVTHNAFSGVKMRAMIGGKIEMYWPGMSWAACEAECDKLVRDYIAAKYCSERVDDDTKE